MSCCHKTVSNSSANRVSYELAQTFQKWVKFIPQGRSYFRTVLYKKGVWTIECENPMDDGLYFVHIFKQSRTMDYGRQNTQFLGFWGTKDGCFRKFHMCFRPNLQKKLEKHKNMTFFFKSENCEQLLQADEGWKPVSEFPHSISSFSESAVLACCVKSSIWKHKNLKIANTKHKFKHSEKSPKSPKQHKKIQWFRVVFRHFTTKKGSFHQVGC